MPGRSKIKYWEICVAAVLALIYGYSVFSGLSVPDTAFFRGDTWEYQSIAVNLAEGRGFRFGGLLPFDAYAFDTADPALFQRFMEAGTSGGVFPSYRTPGYPFVLSLIYGIFGVDPRAAITVQISWIVLICAFLPILGRRLLGRGGFAAGVLGGFVFHFLAADVGDEIMTESLIAVSLFLVLAAWAHLNRGAGATLPAAALFGFSLACALLVKGSLIFLPILFLGFMAFNARRKRLYRPGALVVSMLAFALPLVAYSAYATHASGSFVFLSTQADAVLLGGNNEVSVQTGGWSRHWSEDPNSYFHSQRALHPDQSASSIVASFYAHDPMMLPRAVHRKLIAMFGTRSAVLVGIALLYLFVSLATCLVRSGRTRRVIAVLACVMVPVLVLASSRPDVLTAIAAFAFGPGLAVAAVGCTNRCFRRRISSTWSEPGHVAVTFVIVNFVLLAAITFGDPRFLAPARFVLTLASAYLLIRLVEALELPIDFALTLEEEGPDMITTSYRHIRQIVYSRVAKELATSARYFERLWYWTPSEDDLLLEQLPGRDKRTIQSVADFEAHVESDDARDMVVLNGVLNSSLDIQQILLGLKAKMARGDRLVAVLYNPYLRWAYGLADRLGLRSAPSASTFVTHVDLQNLARISGHEIVRLRPVASFPLRLLGIGTLLDAVMRTLPLIRQLSLVQVATLRPVVPSKHLPSLTIVVPARNEKGNIRSALERLPEIPDADIEVVFVEGHSSDGTWEEIQQVVYEHDGPVSVRAFQQTGKGKADAVRFGFGMAKGELLTILDADLTMPPELLPRFYEAYCAGDGDFINGSRLVYPMESQAMRHLNRMGNIFFSKAVSWVLEVRLGDTLCGTKLVTSRDYRRMMVWRADFGDFDPFGDFEVLFPAATLALGVVDVPIRYRDRVYGSTNISRFRHGIELIRMTLIGLVRIRMGLGKGAALPGDHNGRYHEV